MLANRIKRLRIAFGMNQLDFAKALNVTQPAVSHWETGRSNPDTYQLLRIAKFFGITVDELTNGVEVHVEQPKENEEEIAEERTQKSIDTISDESVTQLYNAAGGGSLEDRLRRLSPALQKQALDYIKFLEMQEDEE